MEHNREDIMTGRIQELGMEIRAKSTVPVASFGLQCFSFSLQTQGWYYGEDHGFGVEDQCLNFTFDI